MSVGKEEPPSFDPGDQTYVPGTELTAEKIRNIGYQEAVPLVLYESLRLAKTALVRHDEIVAKLFPEDVRIALKNSIDFIAAAMAQGPTSVSLEQGRRGELLSALEQSINRHADSRANQEGYAGTFFKDDNGVGRLAEEMARAAHELLMAASKDPMSDIEKRRDQTRDAWLNREEGDDRSTPTNLDPRWDGILASRKENTITLVERLARVVAELKSAYESFSVARYGAVEPIGEAHVEERREADVTVSDKVSRYRDNLDDILKQPEFVWLRRSLQREATSLRYSIGQLDFSQGANPAQYTSDFIKSELTRFESLTSKIKAALAKAREIARRFPEGEIIQNLEGGYNIAANNGVGHWVINPDGSFASPDLGGFEKKGMGRQNFSTDDGSLSWLYDASGKLFARQNRGKDRSGNDVVFETPASNGRVESVGWSLVLPEQLVLLWSKEKTVAPHICNVLKIPRVLTEEQRTAVRKLQDMLKERFDGSKSMSGKTSPDIGRGWNL